MKDYTESRGWRNNNPLNIRRSKIEWIPYAAVVEGWKEAAKTRKRDV